MNSLGKPDKVLLIYVEPTPYIVALIVELQKAWPGALDVLFISENISQEWGVKVTEFQYDVLPGSLISAVNVVWQKLSSGNYGLLHLAGWGYKILVLAMLIGRMLKIPISVESDTQLPIQMSLGKRVIKRLLYPAMFRLPTCFFPGGSRQAAYFRHYGVPDERIVIAQMTVDVAAMAKYSISFPASKKEEFRKRLGIPGEAVIFLYVGRLEPYKGVQDLLTAFEQMPDRYENIHLLFVGDGSLARTVKDKTEVIDVMHYVGRLDGDELLAAYNSSDILVLPSHFESWGLVVNEAMAAELPVIATDRVGCADDLIRHGKTGLLFPARDIVGLRSVMQQLADNPLLCQDMGVAGSELISDWRLEDEAAIIVSTWLDVTS